MTQVYREPLDTGSPTPNSAFRAQLANGSSKDPFHPASAGASKLQDFVGNEFLDMRVIKANNKPTPAAGMGG